MHEDNGSREPLSLARRAPGRAPLGQAPPLSRLNRIADTCAVARPRCRQASLLLAGAAVVLMSAGCAANAHYVANSGDRTYFKVPNAWRLYSQDALLNAQSKLSPDAKNAARAGAWQVAFDSSPRPSLKHLGDPGSAHPSGIAIVQKLSFSDADTLSIQGLRNAFFDIDMAVQNGQARVITYEPKNPSGGFHGFHLVAEVDLNNKTMTIDQTTVVNSELSKVYALIISCKASCYSKFKSNINQVVGSWTVRQN